MLTTADIRAVGPGVWNGWKAQLLRTLYYETEPVLTGGFSEVNRERRVAIAQVEFREWMKDWPEAELDNYISRHYPRLLAESGSGRTRSRMLVSCGRAWSEGRTLATQFSFDAVRGVTELTVVAPDHPRLLSIIAGACAAAGANIVDAQIFTTTDGLALDTIAVTREFEHDEDEARRAGRIADTIEKALRGEIKLPDIVARKAVSRSRLKAFALEPEVNINNEWSNRFTVVEVTGLDRPGLLYELTSTISRLRSTSLPPMSRPSANAWSTCSMSPICSARRSRPRPGRLRSSARCWRCLRARVGRRKAGRTSPRLTRFEVAGKMKKDAAALAGRPCEIRSIPVFLFLLRRLRSPNVLPRIIGLHQPGGDEFFAGPVRVGRSLGLRGQSRRRSGSGHDKSKQKGAFAHFSIPPDLNTG